MKRTAPAQIVRSLGKPHAKRAERMSEAVRSMAVHVETDTIAVILTGHGDITDGLLSKKIRDTVDGECTGTAPVIVDLCELGP